MYLGSRLKTLRTQKKLSQQELAEKLRINRVTYSQYEVNRREPNIETMQKLADFFDVSLDYLLGRSDDPAQVEQDVRTSTPDLADILKKRPLFKGKPIAAKDLDFLEDFLERLHEYSKNKKGT
jgi:transcriptional regulator with XRE-family HTH domain